MTTLARPLRDGITFGWDRPGVPHRGWTCTGVADMEEPIFTCEMCGFSGVRYMHAMEHPDYPEGLHVGCVCAGHMEDDYEAPRRRERTIRNAAARRARVLMRHDRARRLWASPEAWRRSEAGSYWRRVTGSPVTIFRHPREPGRWKACIGERFGTLSYPTPEAAMLGAFDRMFPIRRLLAAPRVKFPGEKGFR